MAGIARGEQECRKRKGECTVHGHVSIHFGVQRYDIIFKYTNQNAGKIKMTLIYMVNSSGVMPVVNCRLQKLMASSL
jgi:hypothetical protein